MIFKHFTIYGGGSWGCALACVAAKRCAIVRLFLRNMQIIDEISLYRTNIKYLDSIPLPSNISASDDLSSLSSAEVIILAVPSISFDIVINKLKNCNLSPHIVLLIATKGLAAQPTQLLSDRINSILPNPVAFISGPSFAREVACNLFTKMTVASIDIDLANKLALSLESQNFVISTTDDIISVQIAGAMKNIIAIQSGMYEARSCGQNAKSALIAQGLKEIMLLSKALGGKLETLCEPAIVGDLMLSCHSAKSRNMKFGYELAIAHDARQFIQNYPYLLEGTLSVNLILELAKKYDLDLPITKEVAHILTI